MPHLRNSLLTGSADDATFATGCFFCSISAMRKDGHRNLSRRERQIMDILHLRNSLLTGSADDATFATGCFFCSISAMRKDGHRNLSRRERQIMDILYQ